MRIAFLNPWRNAAENQAFRCLEIAARRIDQELLECVNSDDIEATAPDFVLATASTQPKLTRFPTYGVIHAYRDQFLSNKDFFYNLLTYDGYFTISESLVTFLKHVLHGIGRQVEIGFYYNTCQDNSSDPNLLSRLRNGDVRLTYFGTNWDKRRSSFFKRLSDCDGVEIYGPPEGWREINRKAYQGALPFDGVSVQAKYRENGVGLVLLSQKHLADDVISNRIFEISSVGAIAICCQMPWLKRNFGDSVYYFEQNAGDQFMVKQISDILDDIRAHPDEAFDRGQRAQQIFREKFAAEKLLQNTVDYHLAVMGRTSVLRAPSHRALASSIRVPRHESRGRPDSGSSLQAPLADVLRPTVPKTTSFPGTPSPGPGVRAFGGSSTERANHPLISMVTRCGGRPIDMLRRAVRSVAEQTFGRYEMIFVRHKPIDLQPIVCEFSSVLNPVVLDCIGGLRSTSLWHGLRHVRGEYFAVLDDDDELMPNHFQELFAVVDETSPESYFAYTGSIRICREPRPTVFNGPPERRLIYNFGIEKCQGFLEQGRFISSNSFVASSSLLDDRLLIDPHLNTAEDTYLILSLLSKSRARFNFRATALYYETENGSDFNSDPNRTDDVLAVALRLFSCHFQRPQIVDALDVVRQQSKWRPPMDTTQVVEERREATVYHVVDSLLSWIPKQRLKSVPCTVDDQRLEMYGSLSSVNAQRTAMSITPPCVPWNYGVVFALNFHPAPNTAYLLEIDACVTQGIIGFGLLNKEEDGFVHRVAVPASLKRVLVHLPIADAGSAGRFVVHQWDSDEEAHVDITSFTIWEERSAGPEPCQ